MEIRLEIQGMTCGGCKAAVERVLAAQPGVTGVAVNLEAGSAIVQAGETALPLALISAVEGAGYDARLAT